MLIASTNTREGDRFPVGIAIGAWLLTAGFGLWAAAQFLVQDAAAGILEPVWLAWLGAILGGLMAAASLVLLLLRRRAKLAIAVPKLVQSLALAQIAFAAALTVVILSEL